MNRMPTHLRPLSLAILLLGLTLLALSGCDHVTPSEEPPDAALAASFASSSQSAAAVGENLELAELFTEPMASSVEDLGLDGDTDFDPWSGEGVNFPELAVINADAYRSAVLIQASAARGVRSSRKITSRLPDIDWAGFGRAEGDTIDVEYFNGPDSLGLNALIEGESPEMVRFVMIREYPGAGPLQIRYRDSEILIDTQGTLEDNSDDAYHRLWVREEWSNGQVATGEVLAEVGGPLVPDGLAVAVHRIDQPMWQPLKSWIQSTVRLEPGDLEVEGDEVFHSFTNTVHYINDAEETAAIVAADEGPIVDGSDVVVTADFTAAPENAWLETVHDEIRVNIGQLDDELDDLLLEIGRESTFDGVDMNGDPPRAIVSFTPENPVPVGGEPCGGNFQEEVYYPADWWVLSLQRQVELTCAGAGTVHVHMNFADGSSLDRTITWADGIATLLEVREPEGISVEGSWNENTGEYLVTTTFAVGSDPEQRVQSGTITEGQVTARDEYFWLDGHEDFTTFTAIEDAAGWSIEGLHVDGPASESFTLSGTTGLLTGTWTRQDEGVDASGGFTLTELAGGGAHLIFDATDVLAAGEPSVDGDFWYEPDGSGHGTLTFTQFGNTVVYTVVWGPDGEGTLTDNQGNLVPLG